MRKERYLIIIGLLAYHTTSFYLKCIIILLENTALPMNFTPCFTWVYGVKQRERILKQKAICDQRLKVHTHKDLVQMTT